MMMIDYVKDRKLKVRNLTTYEKKSALGLHVALSRTLDTDEELSPLPPSFPKMDENMHFASKDYRKKLHSHISLSIHHHTSASVKDSASKEVPYPKYVLNKDVSRINYKLRK